MSQPDEAVTAATFLPRLVAAAKERAAATTDAAGLWARARAMPPPRDLVAALSQPGRLAIIAECKAKSPSQGRLVAHYAAADQAAAYEAAGAAAVSVLTEPHFFDGSLADLAAVRARVQLPLLRKDFLMSGVQVAEARCYGADAVLAICRILTDEQIQEMLAAAAELGMAVLVEVHTAEELARALSLGAPLLGVNNRDLDTFATSLDRALGLAPLIPSGVVSVAESGIRSREDLQRLAAAGYQAALIGQTLMQQGTGLLSGAP